MEILVPVAIVMVVAGFFALLTVVIVAANRQARARMAALHKHAWHYGWRQFGPPAPWPVDAAARSRRTKLALAHGDGEQRIWLVWHQWTETSGSGDSQSTTTKNRSHYYRWLGLDYPPVQVRSRTAIGAFFKPVRGQGTGDPEFDKRFVIKPTDRPEPLHVVTPAIRHAMMAGQVRVPWEISQGTLLQAYEDAPRAETLQPRADAIAYLAHLLGRRDLSA